MRTGGHCLGDGSAHLLLLGPVLAALHASSDLVEGLDSVVASPTGLGQRPTGRPVTNHVVEGLVLALEPVRVQRLHLVVTRIPMLHGSDHAWRWRLSANPLAAAALRRRRSSCSAPEWGSAISPTVPLNAAG